MSLARNLLRSQSMNDKMETLGYLTFAGMIAAAAVATVVFVREIPSLARYLKIRRM